MKKLPITNRLPFLFVSTFSLFALFAFKSPKSCDLANTNIDFVKSQTQTALEANDLKIIKLFSNNALKVIEKTKADFLECGCTEATQPIKAVESNLKLVRTSQKIDDSKVLLRAALQSVVLSIELLHEHETEETQSYYGTDMLVMNTTSTIEDQGGVILPKAKAREELINNSLMEFSQSVDKIMGNMECGQAFYFISKLHKKAKIDLNDISLTENERYYHEKVKDITFQALFKLNGCPVD